MPRRVFDVCVERRHAAGLIVKDLLRRRELWLVDEGLDGTLPAGAMLAARLFAPDAFSMTVGVIVPFDARLMNNVLAEIPQLLDKSSANLADDRRFAETLYRVAVAEGVLDGVDYQDAAPAAG